MGISGAETGTIENVVPEDRHLDPKLKRKERE
jgi:hypothetical protein